MIAYCFNDVKQRAAFHQASALFQRVVFPLVSDRADGVRLQDDVDDDDKERNHGQPQTTAAADVCR